MEKEILELLKKIDTKIDKIENEVKDIKTQVNENTHILKALEHLAEVNKAEHDNLIHQISSISGNVETIKEDICNVEVITASNWKDIAKLKSNIKRA
ncbi:hypothetical protein [uncultured Clostridium sp.]|uniref:hypothetical protein n=1 Tax=uncultured Clostridium sp. TaxID=59620 RepID=UPI00258D9532|nr:hypothetical protein [uncultured Clostridium sp.]